MLLSRQSFESKEHQCNAPEYKTGRHRKPIYIQDM
uniref:Uncharacterized protein n=1 Tax=Anguilla anguilla TaxID=7936 RepID=A0A0E9UBU8_ANGAN